MYEPTSAGNVSACAGSSPPARGGEAAARRGRLLKPERTGGVEKPFSLGIDDAFRVRLDSGVVTEAADAVHHEAVIPAKAGIHFDFSPGRATTTSLLRGVRMQNPENSIFVFDSDTPRPEVNTSERGGKKTKAKMDSGIRRNDDPKRIRHAFPDRSGQPILFGTFSTAPCQGAKTPCQPDVTAPYLFAEASSRTSCLTSLLIRHHIRDTS